VRLPCKVTVASDRPLSGEAVIAALDEAGGYRINGGSGNVRQKSWQGAGNFPAWLAH
jgi:hypothetical protein